MDQEETLILYHLIYDLYIHWISLMTYTEEEKKIFGTWPLFFKSIKN